MELSLRHVLKKDKKYGKFLNKMHFFQKDFFFHQQNQIKNKHSTESMESQSTSARREGAEISRG